MGISAAPAHTVEVLGTLDRRQILLVIPPCTGAHRARAVMALSSRAND
jgi:hypothetical protein